MLDTDWLSGCDHVLITQRTIERLSAAEMIAERTNIHIIGFNNVVNISLFQAFTQWPFLNIFLSCATTRTPGTGIFVSVTDCTGL